MGEAIADGREALIGTLEKATDEAYLQLSRQQRRDSEHAVGLRYERSWRGPLAAALSEARAEDVRRGVTSVGPQRDELYMSVRGLAARTQASQGEQRSLALSLRLAGHALVSDRQGSSPVLLLDDVFSELDPDRSAALASVLAGRAGAADDRRPGPAGIAGDALGSRSATGLSNGVVPERNGTTGERKDRPRRRSPSRCRRRPALIGAPGAMELAGCPAGLG